MAVRTAAAPKTAQKVQRELEDLQLVLKARNGSQHALDDLMRRYTGFVRLKASSYFLAGGDSDDLIQEGMIGLYKAVRDFRPDKETSFRSFAELCVTRQIITAIKTATRFKHSPLNTYVSFSHTPAGQESEGDCTLGDALPGPSVNDPSVCVISTEELQSLVFCLGTGLSSLESQALTLYLEGNSYEEMAEDLGWTRRRSTTRSSASSARSSRTRRRAKCSRRMPLGAHRDRLRTQRLIAVGRLSRPEASRRWLVHGVKEGSWGTMGFPMMKAGGGTRTHDLRITKRCSTS